MSQAAAILKDDSALMDGSAVHVRICFDESEATAVQSRFLNGPYRSTKCSRLIAAGGVVAIVWVVVVRDKRAAEQLSLV